MRGAGICLFLTGMLAFVIGNEFMGRDIYVAFIGLSVLLLAVSATILSKYDLPILKFLLGIFFTIALFLQAQNMSSYLSLVLAVIMLMVTLREYRNDLARDV